jgi:hypothetical protein
VREHRDLGNQHHRLHPKQIVFLSEAQSKDLRLPLGLAAGHMFRIVGMSQLRTMPAQRAFAKKSGSRF